MDHKINDLLQTLKTIKKNLDSLNKNDLQQE